MPPMVGGVFYEHGHRMVAGGVATLMLILAIWIGAREPRRWVKTIAFAALGAVLLQALLGGLTVLFLLPHPISVSHACLGQTFFCLTVTLALVTSPRWPRRAGASGTPDHDDAPSSDGAGSPASRGRGLGSLPIGLRCLAIAPFGAVCLQLVLGAIMRHTNAGLAIPDFPLSFGRLVPAVWSGPIGIHFVHRVWGVAVLALGLTLAMRVLMSAGRRSDLAWPAAFLLLLLPIQVALGAATVLTQKMVAPTTAHVATGALVLATSLVLALRAHLPTSALPRSAVEALPLHLDDRSSSREAASGLDASQVPS